MAGLAPFWPTNNNQADIDAIQVDGGGGVSVLDMLLAPAQRMTGASEKTQKNAPYDPSNIGVNIDTDLLEDPKRIVHELGNFHPGIQGLEPETKAQMNVVATHLMPKAQADAEFYTAKAEKIMEHAAAIHKTQVDHKNNAFQADLKLKQADANHLGNIAGYQTKVVGIANQAREKYAQINLAAGCL